VTEIAPPAALPSDSHEATWDDVQLIDPLGLEVGYRLIPLVDKNSDGELLKRIKSIRKKFAQEIGFLPPVIHIRDNLELRPNAYRIALKGVEIGAGGVPGPVARDQPGQVTAALPGAVTQDPAFGLPAVWIDVAMREQAQVYGYTVVDASTVVATHLNHLVVQHAAELLGRQEVQSLVERTGKDAPSLVEDLIPKTISLTTLQKVLQNLLEEGVPIRDMRTILESVSEHAGRGDAYEITAAVRLSLGRAITQQWYPGAGEMQVMGLDSNLERVLSQALATGANPGLEPGLAQPSDRHATGDAASTESRAAAGAAGAARAARDARALPAPQPAATESAVVRRSAGHARSKSLTSSGVPLEHSQIHRRDEPRRAASRARGTRRRCRRAVEPHAR
jgi:flagellar biosynthesis protein FlhA